MIKDTSTSAEVEIITKGTMAGAQEDTEIQKCNTKIYDTKIEKNPRFDFE